MQKIINSLAAAVIALCMASIYPAHAQTATPADQSSQPVKVINDVFAQAEPVQVPQGKTPRNGDIKFDAGQGTVEIHVSEANILEVLEMLSAQSQKNIIASKEVKGTVTANLYGVTVKEALSAILESNGYTYREKGNFIFVYTVKEAAEIDKASRVMKTQVFHLFYTPAANAVAMIKPVLSGEAQIATNMPASAGIASGTSDVGGNSHAGEELIVITDYQDNLKAVTEVLKQIDQRPKQILIEATIVRASLNEDNALGVDFNMLAGVKLSNLISSNSQITGATPSSTATPSASGVGSVGTGSNFSNAVQGGMKVGFVSDNVSVFLSALEGITDTAVLANPKILTLNRQRGEVIVGRKDGYLTSTTTQTSTIQSVEFLDTGTRLVFRPYIGDDGYVRMEIHPEDSSGGLTSSNLPFKTTTEVTSNIMVKDGHTIVIGGLFREASDSTKSQVPVLGNVPVAGALFRNQRDRTIREEIIILLTPHIISDDAAFSEAADEIRKDAERLRVGVRKGMMPWGRERLSELSYELAQDELKKAKPNLTIAQWHLNCATNLNPKFLAAIKLKEKISGKMLQIEDGSMTRDFVKKLMLKEMENHKPASTAGITAPPVVTHEPVQITTPASASAQSAQVAPKKTDSVLNKNESTDDAIKRWVNSGSETTLTATEQGK